MKLVLFKKLIDTEETCKAYLKIMREERGYLIYLRMQRAPLKQSTKELNTIGRR